MKYRIGSQVINADHIVRVIYFEAHDKSTSQCDITLTSISTLELDNGATSDGVTLINEQADRFWNAYSADALDVMAGEAA